MEEGARINFFKMNFEIVLDRYLEILKPTAKVIFFLNDLREDYINEGIPFKEFIDRSTNEFGYFPFRAKHKYDDFIFDDKNLTRILFLIKDDNVYLDRLFQ